MEGYTKLRLKSDLNQHARDGNTDHYWTTDTLVFKGFSYSSSDDLRLCLSCCMEKQLLQFRWWPTIPVSDYVNQNLLKENNPERVKTNW